MVCWVRISAKEKNKSRERRYKVPVEVGVKFLLRWPGSPQLEGRTEKDLEEKEEPGMQVSGIRAFSAEGPASAKVLRWRTRLGCSRRSKEVATEAGAYILLFMLELLLHSCSSEELG